MPYRDARLINKPRLVSTSPPIALPPSNCYTEMGNYKPGPRTKDGKCNDWIRFQTATYKEKVCEQDFHGSKGCHKMPGEDYYGCYFSTTLPLFRQGQDLGKTLQGLAVEEGWGFADENGKRWDYCSMNNKVDYMGFVSSQKSLIWFRYIILICPPLTLKPPTALWRRVCPVSPWRVSEILLVLQKIPRWPHWQSAVGLLFPGSIGIGKRLNDTRCDGTQTMREMDIDECTWKGKHQKQKLKNQDSEDQDTVDQDQSIRNHDHQYHT